MRIGFHVAVPVFAMLAGCGGPLAAVRKQASTDMSCAENSVKVTSASAGSETLYYAEGCQQLHRYFAYCGLTGYCGLVQGVDALDIIRRQASFDLQCDAPTLAVQRLNDDTFGVTGCSKRVSYLLLCEVHNLKQECRVLQNTQTQ